jgi:hypothetical protein
MANDGALDSIKDQVSNVERNLSDTFHVPDISKALDTVSDTAEKAVNTGKNLVDKAKAYVNKTAPPPAHTPSYKDGTDYVPKTGPAKLHKGEAVLNKEDAKEHRKEKGNDMSKESVMKEATSSMAGKKEEKPKKEVESIHTRHAKNGGYIHTHHHTHPEHHPDEEHISKDQDAMADHMLQNMGQPNPGEAEADAGQSGIPGDAGAAGAGAAGAGAGAPQAASATPPPAAGAPPAGASPMGM